MWGEILSPRSAFYAGAWPFRLGLLADEGTLASKTFLQSSCQIISMLDWTKYDRGPQSGHLHHLWYKLNCGGQSTS